MKVVVVGGGAREHALCSALSRDLAVAELFCAPGNAGTAEVATPRSVDPTDPAAVAALAADVAADLVVIGPEVALVRGAADACRARGIPTFGPSAAAARIEGSKTFAKDVMAAAGVPTAQSRTCETPAQVAAALAAFGPPYVVKDDGLAAGKGVLVTEDRAAALAHAAGQARVVVEEFLDGPEVSLFALTDGRTVVPLLPAQDFKRAGEGDTGPNTGGMGAYAPLPWAPGDLVVEALRTVLQPTVDEMARRGTPYAGLLYAGLALTSGGLRVIEFNARFGDPETQVVLALLASPLAGLLSATATGELAAQSAPRWRSGAAVTVVVAAAGYPGPVRTGDPVDGLVAAAAVPGVEILHAGTARRGGEVVSTGGRVLSVTGTGQDLAAARRAAYQAVGHIRLAGSWCRGDIAERAAATATAAAASVGASR